MEGQPECFSDQLVNSGKTGMVLYSWNFLVNVSFIPLEFFISPLLYTLTNMKTWFSSSAGLLLPLLQVL